MVRNNDSLEEISKISAVHPHSFDAGIKVDYYDEDDEAATYTIAHVNTTTRKSSPAMLNYNNRRGTRQGGGGKELIGNELHERQPQSSTSETPTKNSNNSLRYNANFTAWKRKKDSKIVGLKHYGLESPRHQLHNTLSDLDDHYCSNNSKCHATTSQPSSAQPKRRIATWWMRSLLCQQSPRRSDSNNNSNSNISETTPTNFKKNRLFAVEKEEEMVRKNVTKNPFILFYLGNLAAIKVLIYYFSKCHRIPHQYNPEYFVCCF